MVVGDKIKDVIVNLHYLMSSVDVKQNKSVLWAYKKDLLGFTRYTHIYAQSIGLTCFSVTARSERIRFERKSNEAFESPTQKTRLSYSSPYTTFDMFTTRRPTRSWVTPMACVSYKTSKQSLRTYLLAQSRLWKEEDWSSSS